MYCAKCGSEIPKDTKQCPKCGLTNEFVEAAPKRNKKKLLLMGIIGLALLAALALVAAVIAGRGDRSVTSAPKPMSGAPANITTAPPGQPSNGNLTTAPPAAPGSGMNTPPGVAKLKPTKEMLDYLDYVKKVEQHRQLLLKDTDDALMLASGGQTQGLLDMIDMAMDPDGEKARDPLADTKKELNRQYKNWLSTISFFDKKAAPSECREFSGAYRSMLYYETKAIGDIAVGFNSVNIMDPKDMGKLLTQLQKMKRDPTIQQNIDKSADSADGKLNDLVARYDIQKPFDVPREQQTSGNIMNF